MDYKTMLNTANTHLAKQHEALNKLANMAEMCSIMGEDFRPDLAEDDIHTAYSAALEVASTMQKLMPIPASDIPKTDINSTNSELVNTTYDAGSGAFTVCINTIPPLKKRVSSSRFLALLCSEITQQLLQILPPNFKLYAAVYAIYLHHFAAATPATVPYFDNDNITIKGLLDAVVPYVCLDDAFQFCDNLYIAQPDIRAYTELVIIPKGRLWQWAKSRPELDFFKELGSKI